MIIETKPVLKENPKNPVTGAEINISRNFLLVVADGQGCGLPHCNCSPPNFISVADGETLMVVTLSDEEAKTLRESGHLEVRRD